MYSLFKISWCAHKFKLVFRNGSFTFLTICDLLPHSIPFSSVNEEMWNEFETKSESPWER